MISARHPLGLWLLLLLLISITGIKLNLILKIWSDNHLIIAPDEITGKDTPRSPYLAFAKAWQLNNTGKFQQALQIYNAVEHTAPPELIEPVRYNMGVIYLQQAAKLWNAKGVYEYKQINTLLDLAEQSFRQILEQHPNNWPARYNLDYALRIRPPAKLAEDADWQGTKTSVHAIMPGVPAGGP